NFAIDEVVGLKINGTFGRANRAQHRWKNLIAVDQRGDFITADKIRTEQRTGRLPKFRRRRRVKRRYFLPRLLADLHRATAAKDHDGQERTGRKLISA